MSNPVGLPLQSLERPQFGIEGPYGTSVACTRSLVCIDNDGIELDDDEKSESRGRAGLAFESGEDIVDLRSKGNISKLLPDYRDMGYLLSSFLGPSADTTLVSGVYQHTWFDYGYKPIDPQSYTLEFADGANLRHLKATGVIVNGLKINSENGKALKGSAPLMGKKCQDGASVSSGQNAVLLVSFIGGPTGGTFIFQDPATGAQVVITYAATLTAASVQTSIQSLGGNWATATVSGSNGGPFTITNPLGIFLPPLVVIWFDANGNNTMTGGTNPHPVLSTSPQGGMKMNSSLIIQPGDVAFTFASTLTNLLNTPLAATEHYKTDIDLGERIMQRMRQSANTIEPTGVQQKDAKEIKDKIAFQTAYDSSIATLIAAAQANQFKYGRYACTAGGTVTPIVVNSSIYPFQFIIDACCQPRWKKRGTRDNIRAVDFDFNPTFDDATGFRMRVMMINDVPNYNTN